MPRRRLRVGDEPPQDDAPETSGPEQAAPLDPEPREPTDLERAVALLWLAREDVDVFIELVLRGEERQERIEQAPHHRELQAALTRHDRVVAFEPVETGKCEVAGSRVLLSNGEWRPIEQVVRGSRLLVLDPESMKYRKVRVSAAFRNGRRKTVVLTLWSGRKLEVTKNHPLRTARGWVRADQLSIGNYVACSRETKLSGRKMRAGDAALLGYLIGDGGLTDPHRINWTNADPGLVAHVESLCHARGWHVRKSGGLYGYSLDREEAVCEKKRNPVAWSRAHDIHGLGAANKRVPAAIWTGTTRDVADFIGSYFACDGHVCTQDNGGVEFSSVSKGLLLDVQLLLLRLGIQSRVRYHPVLYRGAMRPSWRLFVSGAEAVKRFRDRIPVEGVKGRRLAGIRISKRLSSIGDLVPREWAEMIGGVRSGEADRIKLMHHPDHGNHRTMIRKLLARRADPSIELICSDAVYWDRVVKVEPGESETYGIEVDDSCSCYLSSGVVSHNSTQLLGRVLWEIGRNPSIRIAYISGTAAQARKFLKSVREYVESSAVYRAIFPAVRRSTCEGSPWTQTQIEVERPFGIREPTLACYGDRTDATLGARLEVVILDDILDHENTRTSEQRAAVHEWATGNSVVGRLVAGGKLWFVGTPWHPADAMHEVAKRTDVWHVIRRAVVENGPVETGDLLWPLKWPRERVLARRREVTELEFARMMLCRARDDATARFRPQWFERARQRGLGQSAPFRYRGPLVTVAGVDLAVGQKSENDETAITTLAVHPDGTRQVLYVEAGRWNAMEIRNKIIATWRRYDCQVIYVEANACFALGTRVLTSRGYVPIENVAVGDEVWTHRGRWRRVTEVISGRSKTFVDVKPRGGLPIRCSINHWFRARLAGRLPGRSGGHHRPVGEAKWTSIGALRRPVYVEIPVPKWKRMRPVLDLPATARDRASRVPVGERVALLLGLYMAEGSSTRAQVSFTLSRREEHLDRFLTRTLLKLVPPGASVATYFPGRGVRRVTANSTQLARAMSRFGTRASKRLPPEWWGWPVRTRLAVVRGWLLGDGCVRANNAKTGRPGRYFSGASISRDWMMFARATLLEAGYRATLSVSKRRESVIEGRRVARKPIYCLSLCNEDSNRIRGTMSARVEAEHWPAVPRVGRKSHACVVQDDLGAWTRVRVGGVEGGGEVRNLVVEDDHTFVVEDVVVHNAQRYMVDMVGEASGCPVEGFVTGSGKHDPVYGFEQMAVELANGKWVIPSVGEPEVMRQIQRLVEEVLFYSPSEHTGDRAMSCYMAREAAKAVGGSAVAAPSLAR